MEFSEVTIANGNTSDVTMRVTTDACSLEAVLVPLSKSIPLVEKFCTWYENPTDLKEFANQIQRLGLCRRTLYWCKYPCSVSRIENVMKKRSKYNDLIYRKRLPPVERAPLPGAHAFALETSQFEKGWWTGIPVVRGVQIRCYLESFLSRGEIWRRKIAD